MIQLNTLFCPKGAHKKRKIVGRGTSSGHGKTSCRGQKGQMSRTGSRRRPGFEGGQMPLIRRVPKRGFHSLYHPKQLIINVSDLINFAKNSVVSPDILKELNIFKDGCIFKVLGSGEIKNALTVTAHKISKSAQEKIQKAGGKAELIKFA